MGQQSLVSWIENAEAERVSTPLHYNLPEHVQALAIRLCGSAPVPESMRLLRSLQAGAAFETNEEQVCREALDQAIAMLGARLGAKPSGNDV